MDALLNNVAPILMLIAFGFFLRRQNYFEDVAIQRLTSMVAGILVPCVLFNTFISLNFTAAHVWLAAAFFLLLVLLLSLSFLACRFFPPKRRFFPLFFCCFAFGFMAIPLFSTVFGEENMDYLAAIGLGHELFVGLVFMPVAQLWLKREPASFRSVGKTLFSPLFIMVAAALLLRFTGLKPAVEATVLGRSLLNVISRLGGITTVLIMIIVGYRIRLDDRSKLRESAALVGVRYLFTFGVGYLYKFLVMDRLAGHDVYFDYAFFTLLSQHGSVLLVAYVGEHSSQDALEVASSSLVINELAGIALYLLFVFFFL